jgi:hypothetical protein
VFRTIEIPYWFKKLAAGVGPGYIALQETALWSREEARAV